MGFYRFAVQMCIEINFFFAKKHIIISYIRALLTHQSAGYRTKHIEYCVILSLPQIQPYTGGGRGGGSERYRPVLFLL